MAVQLASGQPPRDALLELEEVRNRIEEQFAQNRTMVASTIAVSTGLSVGYVLWLVRGGLLLTSVLSALPAWQVVDLGDEGFALIKVNKVLPLQIVPEEEKATQAQFATYWARAEAEAYLRALQREYKVKILKPQAGAAKAEEKSASGG